MMEHPEFWWILGSVCALLGTITIKIIWDWLKNRPETEKRASKRQCPLDRGGVIQTMQNMDDMLVIMGKKLDKIDNDLTIGVDVARKNADHYAEFVKGLSGLDSGIRQMLSEMRTQTQILLTIRNNGNGQK